ncbi:unnamed protein product [Caenorhabditis nigoni]
MTRVAESEISSLTEGNELSNLSECAITDLTAADINKKLKLNAATGLLLVKLLPENQDDMTDSHVGLASTLKEHHMHKTQILSEKKKMEATDALSHSINSSVPRYDLDRRYVVVSLLRAHDPIKLGLLHRIRFTEPLCSNQFSNV